MRPRPTKAAQDYLVRGEQAYEAQRAAKARFVSANLRLVVNMAQRYAKSGKLSLEDLIQEGNLGLMKAVERFDPERGFRFSTYEAWWIRHALTRGLSDTGSLVRVPVHALEARGQVARASATHRQRTGQNPSIEALSEATGLAPGRVEAVSQIVADMPYYLDAPLANDTERRFVDLLRDERMPSPEQRAVERDEGARLGGLIDVLTPMEQQIVKARYGLDGSGERTLKEVGAYYNLSRERIRQIQELALRKMRSRYRELEGEAKTG